MVRAKFQMSAGMSDWESNLTACAQLVSDNRPTVVIDRLITGSSSRLASVCVYKRMDRGPNDHAL